MEKEKITPFKITSYLRANFSEKYKKNWLYFLFFKPEYYLTKVVYATLLVGIVTFIINYFYVNSHFYETLKIPSTTHTVLGFVVGLVLVFRSNSAYERWWSGRKHLETISANCKFFAIKLDVFLQDNTIKKEFFLEFERFLASFLTFLKGSTKRMLNHSRNDYLKSILKKIAILEKNGQLSSHHTSKLESYLYNIIKATTACETIKNTPIPLSHSLHTKAVMFIYLLTLPFGLFHDLGYFSTVMVMIMFFLVAGIDIISNEIENPFYGDPNDLPVEMLINEIYDNINYNLNKK
jgi:putative membrane protein